MICKGLLLVVCVLAMSIYSYSAILTIPVVPMYFRLCTGR